MDDGLDRPASRELIRLRGAWRFLLPYRAQVIFASIALVLTATVTLSIGQGMRLLIDRGFGEGSASVLVESIGVFAVLVVLLTVGTFVRFYFVSWVGERVSADIRRAVSGGECGRIHVALVRQKPAAARFDIGRKGPGFCRRRDRQIASLRLEPGQIDNRMQTNR